MAGEARALANGAERIDFETDPSRYRHWKLAVDGETATLKMDVDENAGLLIRRNGHVPPSVLERIWCWDKRDRVRVLPAPGQPEHLRRFRCHPNASIGGPYDPVEPGRSADIVELLCNLMQARFLQ